MRMMMTVMIMIMMMRRKGLDGEKEASHAFRAMLWSQFAEALPISLVSMSTFSRKATKYYPVMNGK